MVGTTREAISLPTLKTFNAFGRIYARCVCDAGRSRKFEIKGWRTAGNGWASLRNHRDGKADNNYRCRRQNHPDPTHATVRPGTG